MCRITRTPENWLNEGMTTSVDTKSADMSESEPGSTPSLADLASAAKKDRNRAVDFYRVVAMAAVALGHWAAIAMAVGPDGQLLSGNALSEAPSLAALTWLFQVMPLFFVVGGYSSAASLDAHNRVGKDGSTGRPQDWVAARLRRMLAPTAVLAATWLVLTVVGSLLGFGSLIITGAAAAVIPLWFLSNYTVDTAIAPYLLPRFRQNPALVAGAGVALFCGLEALRFAGVPYLPQINWILGWLLFQVAGFAWRDGLLPTGRRLAAVAAGLWTLAVAAVTVGPYPVSMVHFPGIGDLSPTHPPSAALMLFGAAFSATALVAAPRISAWFSNGTPAAVKAWSAVVAGNSIAMSVYLWHFTAAVGAGAVLYALGWLPTAAVGTAAWWLQKLPLFGLSFVFLAAIVAVVARFEQRALLAPRRPWDHGQLSMLALAAVISAAIKIWTIGSPVAVVACAAAVFGIHRFILEPRPSRLTHGAKNKKML